MATSRVLAPEQEGSLHGFTPPIAKPRTHFKGGGSGFIITRPPRSSSADGPRGGGWRSAKDTAEASRVNRKLQNMPFAGKEIPPSNGTPRSAGMYGLPHWQTETPFATQAESDWGSRSFEPAYAVTGPQSDRREIEERYSTTSEAAYRSPPPQSARAHYKSRAAGSVDSAYDTWLKRGTKHGGYGRPSEFPLEHVTRPPKQRPPAPPAPYWWYESPLTKEREKPNEGGDKLCDKRWTATLRPVQDRDGRDGNVDARGRIVMWV